MTSILNAWIHFINKVNFIMGLVWNFSYDVIFLFFFLQKYVSFYVKLTAILRKPKMTINISSNSIPSQSILNLERIIPGLFIQSNVFRQNTDKQLKVAKIVRLKIL